MHATVTHVRQQMVIELQPRVRATAKRLLRQRSVPVDLDELVSVGNLGLLEAVDRFDPQRAASFEAYVERRVYGAMMDYVRAQVWAPRSVAARARELNDAAETLQRAKGRAPTREEMAEKLGVSPVTYDRFRTQATTLTVISGDYHVHEEGGETILSQQASQEVAVEDRCIAAQQRSWVHNAVDQLPTNERLVLTRYYFEEQTMATIAAGLGVSEGRVSQIHAQALRRLRAMRELAEVPVDHVEARELAANTLEPLDRLLAKQR